MLAANCVPMLGPCASEEPPPWLAGTCIGGGCIEGRDEEPGGSGMIKGNSCG